MQAHTCNIETNLLIFVPKQRAPVLPGNSFFIHYGRKVLVIACIRKRLLYASGWDTYYKAALSTRDRKVMDLPCALCWVEWCRGDLFLDVLVHAEDFVAFLCYYRLTFKTLVQTKLSCAPSASANHVRECCSSSRRRLVIWGQFSKKNRGLISAVVQCFTVLTL